MCSCHDDCLTHHFLSQLSFTVKKLNISHHLAGFNVLFYIMCNRFVVCSLNDFYLQPYRAAEGKYLTPILEKSIISKVIPNYTCCTLSHPLGKRVTVRLFAFFMISATKLLRYISDIFFPRNITQLLPRSWRNVCKTTACTNSSNRCLVSCTGTLSWNSLFSPCKSFL